jgi:hypothetical protein
LPFTREDVQAEKISQQVVRATAPDRQPRFFGLLYFAPNRIYMKLSKEFFRGWAQIQSMEHEFAIGSTSGVGIFWAYRTDFDVAPVPLFPLLRNVS